MSSLTTFNLGRGCVTSIVPANASGSPTPTPIKQLKTVSFAGHTTSFEDVTNMDSPSGVANGLPVEEYAPTTISPGTANIQGVFSDNDPGQIALAAGQYSGTLFTVTHQFAPKPGQTKGFLRSYNAYVQDCNGPDAQYNKASTLSATLKINGPITDTPGA